MFANFDKVTILIFIYNITELYQNNWIIQVRKHLKFQEILYDLSNNKLFCVPKVCCFFVSVSTKVLWLDEKTGIDIQIGMKALLVLSILNPWDTC